MNAEQILDFIRTMAMSQGFYGRLKGDLFFCTHDKEWYPDAVHGNFLLR